MCKVYVYIYIYIYIYVCVCICMNLFLLNCTIKVLFNTCEYRSNVLAYNLEIFSMKSVFVTASKTWQ